MSTATLQPVPTTGTLRPSATPVRKPFRLIRHSLALTKRSLIKTWRTRSP